MVRKYWIDKITICSIFILVSVFFSDKVFASQKAPVATDNNNMSWHDCKLLQVDGKGWPDTESFYDRLPSKAKKTVSESTWRISHHSTGLCVRFITDTASLKVRWVLIDEKLEMPHMPATGVSGVDIYAKDDTGQWHFLSNGRPVSVSNTTTFKLSSAKEYMLYLPLYNGVKSVEIGIDKNSTISKPVESLRKPILFYGTSITQGACASRPGMSATAIAGRRLDMPVINLGFSGGGKLEPEMSDLLAELDPAVYVIDGLWNMGKLSEEEISKRFEIFVKKIRGVHPDTPILLVEDSNYKNITPTPRGLILRAIYEKLVKSGITGLYFLSNESMIGKDGEATVDGCHLNDLGMMRQADVFVKTLSPILSSSTNSKRIAEHHADVDGEKVLHNAENK
jgi:hypothetical protein